MRSMHVNRAVVLLLILNLAALVWIGFEVSGPAPAPSARDGRAAEQLGDELRRLTTALREFRLPAPNPPSGAAGGDRTPVPVGEAGDALSNDALIAELRALRAALERVALSSAAPEVSLGAAAASAPPKDAAAVGRLIQDLLREEETTRRGLLFTPAGEMLTRLGRPDEVTTGGGVMNWFYYSDDGQSALHLVILDGLVVQVWG
jgi:hypothetical protein